MKSEPSTVERYEALLQRLQDVARRLEDGELPLAETLSLYEEGVALAAQCEALLDAAELRVQQLVAGTTGPTLAPWSGD